MARESQKGYIDAELIPIKAESWALRVATAAVSMLPWGLVAGGIIMVTQGQEAAGVFTAIAGTLGGGWQIIQATRKPKS